MIVHCKIHLIYELRFYKSIWPMCFLAYLTNLPSELQSQHMNFTHFRSFLNKLNLPQRLVK